eukprot:7636821-Pyramimonas_sp.AAC.1
MATSTPASGRPTHLRLLSGPSTRPMVWYTVHSVTPYVLCSLPPAPHTAAMAVGMGSPAW